MRPSIVAFLSISCLLMFPQSHDLGGLRAHIYQIQQRSDKHGSDQIRIHFVVCRGRRSGGRVGCGGCSGDGGDQGPWVCKPHGERRKRLQHEVRWENGLLKGAELRAGEGAVGYDAADEGLEDGGAEEGAIAVVALALRLHGT